MKEELIAKFKKSKKSGIKLLAIASSMVVISLSVSGCVKSVPCDIDELHAHKYVNKNSSVCKYVVSEKEYLYDFYRTDEYIPVTKEEEKLLEYMSNNNLYKISENENIINDVTKTHNDFLEYEYEYESDDTIIITSPIGDMIYTTIIPDTSTKYSWTTDENHEDLTGNTRIGHYQYCAYNISKNSKGQFVIIESGYVDDLNEIKNEYPYINDSFYDIKYITDQKLVEKAKEKIK